MSLDDFKKIMSTVTAGGGRRVVCGGFDVERYPYYKEGMMGRGA